MYRNTYEQLIAYVAITHLRIASVHTRTGIIIICVCSSALSSPSPHTHSASTQRQWKDAPNTGSYSKAYKGREFSTGLESKEWMHSVLVCGQLVPV